MSLLWVIIGILASEYDEKHDSFVAMPLALFAAIVVWVVFD